MPQPDVILGAVIRKLDGQPYGGVIFKQRLGQLLASLQFQHSRI